MSNLICNLKQTTTDLLFKSNIPLSVLISFQYEVVFAQHRRVQL